MLGMAFGVSIAGPVAPMPDKETSTHTPSGDAAPVDISIEPDIVVTARGERRIGRDRAASAGAVSGDDIRARPLLRTNEVAEAVPGLLAVQHSGGGKAAQYYIRGFNLDHGTDFSIALDGVPMNLPTQAHAQGYLDLNGLIPETIDRIEYRKGPYDARDGDFSLVAAATMTTLDRALPSIALEAGSYGYRRIVGFGSVPFAGGDLVLAGELKANDGFWALPEGLRHAGAFAKYTVVIHPGASDTTTVRTVLVVDPARKLRLTLTYPASTGRNFAEILRVIDSLQLTDRHKVATPADWQQGDDVIIVPSVDDDAARALFPGGWEAPLPYLRTVRQPA